uniref:ATP synthase F0 subunit 8 n=1 Tax=Myrsidea sp. ADS-2020 TaxID=2794901 RepID=A0A7T1HF23_9NEOP|nr:ATP synthase F0 subunit 8 [Myrsidea sp. ADS-2020]
MPMPQMFPMPILLLMALVSILYLLGTVRVFWQLREHASMPSVSYIMMVSDKSLLYIQTW